MARRQIFPINGGRMITVPSGCRPDSVSIQVCVPTQLLPVLTLKGAELGVWFPFAAIRFCGCDLEECGTSCGVPVMCSGSSLYVNGSITRASFWVNKVSAKDENILPVPFEYEVRVSSG